MKYTNHQLEMAALLLSLWDQYLLNREEVFQPTMTDFMRYVRDHIPNTSSTEPRTCLVCGQGIERAPEPMRLPSGKYVNSKSRVEASDAKSALRAMTKDDVKAIRELYERGLSLARIRQRLSLDVTLTRLQTVVNKPW